MRRREEEMTLLKEGRVTREWFRKWGVGKREGSGGNRSESRDEWS